MKYTYLAGERFGRLTYVGAPFGWRDKKLHTFNCDCGKTILLSPISARSGNTRSCGCLRREEFGARARTHGDSGSTEHRSWKAMMGRCTRVNDTAYHCYGGRGIKVCSRWQAGYANFLSDMGRKPTREHTLDRLDPNGNYCPDNCRWATRKEQGQNRRDRTIDIGNGEESVGILCRRHGIRRRSVAQRIRNNGEDLETAMLHFLRKQQHQKAP